MSHSIRCVQQNSPEWKKWCVKHKVSWVWWLVFPLPLYPCTHTSVGLTQREANDLRAQTSLLCSKWEVALYLCFRQTPVEQTTREQLDSKPVWQRLSTLPFFVIKSLKGKLQISLIIINYCKLCWRGNRYLWLQFCSFRFPPSGWRTGRNVFSFKLYLTNIRIHLGRIKLQWEKGSILALISWV